MMVYMSRMKGVLILHGWNAALIGLGIGGLGTGLGSLLSYGVRYFRASFIPFLLSMMTGMIFVFVLLEIMPESIEIGGWLATGGGMAIGLWFIHQFEKWSHKVIIITSSPQKDLFLRTGVILSAAVAIHNFPTGIAMGASLTNSPAVGFQLGLTMILHNIPEGLAIGLPLNSLSAIVRRYQPDLVNNNWEFSFESLSSVIFKWFSKMRMTKKHNPPYFQKWSGMD